MSAAGRKTKADFSGPSDAAVLALIAEGDIAALSSLYDRYAPGLLRFASRLVGTQDAPDIVQSAFLRVVGLARGYDASFPSARSWLYGIVVRVIREHRRSLHRWASTLLKLAAQPAKATVSISEARPDLDACLSQLTLPKRTVLLLSEVEGFTNEEIATMLSIPIGTVWTRLHHARRELRQLYHEDDP
ncbi:MAG TPA: RNA polymerase sigma factor [Polyangiaceae bacterium]|nr:RNA polymerase sigma factor [Polyangiaceae bacterium]